VRIFVTSDQINGNSVRITGSDALHLIRSLRIKIGETLIVCDMSRREYICEAENISSDTVIAKIIKSQISENEPPYRAAAYLALSKGERFELAIQKSVELGVSEIIPFESEHTIITASDALKKIARWQKIAAEAAMQCGRAIIPNIRDPINFKNVIEEVSRGSGLRFLCYEGDGTLPLSKLLMGQTVPDRITFIIGPEGGFSTRETQITSAAKISLCGLGKRILRCETAPLYVLTALAYEFELKRQGQPQPEVNPDYE
jgi:RNA methyltransferase, RsmE family